VELMETSLLLPTIHVPGWDIASIIGSGINGNGVYFTSTAIPSKLSLLLLEVELMETYCTESYREN